MGFEIGSFCWKLRQNIQNYQTDRRNTTTRRASSLQQLDIGFETSKCFIKNLLCFRSRTRCWCSTSRPTDTGGVQHRIGKYFPNKKLSVLAEICRSWDKKVKQEPRRINHQDLTFYVSQQTRLLVYFSPFTASRVLAASKHLPCSGQTKHSLDSSFQRIRVRDLRVRGDRGQSVRDSFPWD